MKFLTFLCALLFALLLLCGVALAYLQFADLGAYRERIAALVGNAIDREVRIDGELDVDLWPELYFAIGDVSVANADWGSEPTMASVGRASLRIATRSLWRGPLLIRDLELRQVDILLESDAAGTSNWDFPAADSSDADEPVAVEPPPTGTGLIIDRALLENLRLRQRSGGEEKIYQLAALELTADADDRQLLSGKGQADDLAFSIAGEFDTRQQVAATGALHYDLALALGATQVVVAGQRAQPESGVEHLTLQVQASELQLLLDRFAVPLSVNGATQFDVDLQLGDGSVAGTAQGSLGELALGASIEGSAEALHIQGQLASLATLGAMLAVEGLPAQPLELDTTLGLDAGLLEIRSLILTSGDTRVEAAGRLAGQAGPSTLEIKAGGALASQWNGELPALPFQLDATVDSSPAGFSADPLHLVLGDSDISGRAALASGEGGAITASLQSKRIDLPQLLGPAAAAPDPNSPAASAAPGGRYVFSEEPLPFDALQGKEVELDWQIDDLLTEALAFSAVQLDLQLSQGTLQLNTDFRTADGGVGRNRLTLKTTEEGAEVALQNQLRDLRVNLLSGEVASSSDIPPLSLTLDLQSSGASARALAAGSNGSALLTIGPGVLANSLVEKFSGDILAQLVSALNPFAKTNPKMQLQCGTVQAKVASGMVSIEPMAMQSDKLKVVAGGELDLHSEKLNIEFNTKPREGVGVSADMFVTPFVSLEGTLAQPRVGFNETSTLLTAGAAVATGGMSFLWKGIYDRATGAIDLCKQFAQDYPQPPLR